MTENGKLRDRIVLLLNHCPVEKEKKPLVDTKSAKSKNKNTSNERKSFSECYVVVAVNN